MKTLARCFAPGLLLAMTLGNAAAQGPADAGARNYPNKTIRIVVPFPPGGAGDILARTIAENLARRWGQQVVVENRPGGNTIIGAEIVAKAAPDGYSLLAAIDSTLVMNQSLYRKLPYDTLRDFAPITLTAFGQPILIVSAATGPKSVRELIQLAKANPGKLSFGAGVITTQLAAELFKSMAGVDILHVPYKGSAPTVQGLLSADVTMIVDGVSASLPHIKSGRFRVLANFGSRPIGALPNVPTMAAESGLPGLEVKIWHALLAPAGTPPDVVARLEQEVASILKTQEVRDRLATFGLETDGSTSAALAAYIRSETERWAKVIKQAGIPQE